MKWILQHKDYGLGNFINLTPTIRYMSLHEHRKIPVFFESRYLAELFEDSPFIEVLKTRPETDPILASSMICRTGHMEDWKYVFESFYGSQPSFHKSLVNLPTKKLAVILNGCATDEKAKYKDPGEEIYKHILKRINSMYSTIFVGNFADARRSPYLVDACDATVTGNIKFAVSMIDKCDIVISNDTGLYHAAGALGKDGFIMWKDTKFLKNKSPNQNFTHSMKGNWFKDFDRWIR